MEVTREDLQRLRRKYDAERAKRLRPDTNDQFLEVTDDFLGDPHTEPIVREPLFDDWDVIVIGTGIAGLTMAARLRELGIERIRLIDKAGDVGGTWYWNRYPGVRCDVESYIYMPLLEETGYIPSEKYATGREIFEHAQRIARHYDLYRDACFQTEVTEAVWDEAASQWVVSTTRGDRLRARFIFNAPGVLQRPKLPAISGIADFKGHRFLTSRWDYEYTGGDASGGLTGLADKRVGFIGTGATGVQAIPFLAEHSQHLYVFQRTPSTIHARQNVPTDPAWAQTLRPGWQEQRMTNFTTLVGGGHQEVDLVDDSFTQAIGKLAFLFPRDEEEHEGADASELSELADLAHMEEIRARVESVVEDPAVAECLKPYYRLFCKRPGFSDVFLPVFNRPNVTLVHTDGRGIDRITETSVVCGDDEYEVDCLIFGTGFEVGTGYTRRSGYEIRGRDGEALTEKWSPYAKTYQGLYVHGFPNCMFVGGPQSGFDFNYMHTIEIQTKHLAHVVAQMLRTGATTVEATEEAERYWVSELERLGEGRFDFLEACTPGYFNNEGKRDKGLLYDRGYHGGLLAYEAELKTWRETGTADGLVFGAGPDGDWPGRSSAYVPAPG